MSPKRAAMRTGPWTIGYSRNPHNLTASQPKKQLVDHGYTLTAVCSTLSDCFWHREITSDYPSVSFCGVTPAVMSDDHDHHNILLMKDGHDDHNRR
jgi:hypothetical protein